MKYKKLVKAIFRGYDLYYTVLATFILYLVTPETVTVRLGFFVLFFFQMIAVYIGMGRISDYIEKARAVDYMTDFKVTDSIGHMMNLFLITSTIMVIGLIFGYVFLFLDTVSRIVYVSYFFASFYGFTALLGATYFMVDLEKVVIDNL